MLNFGVRQLPEALFGNAPSRSIWISTTVLFVIENPALKTLGYFQQKKKTLNTCQVLNLRRVRGQNVHATNQAACLSYALGSRAPRPYFLGVSLQVFSRKPTRPEPMWYASKSAGFLR